MLASTVDEEGTLRQAEDDSLSASGCNTCGASQETRCASLTLVLKSGVVDGQDDWLINSGSRWCWCGRSKGSGGGGVSHGRVDSACTSCVDLEGCWCVVDGDVGISVDVEDCSGGDVGRDVDWVLNGGWCNSDTSTGAGQVTLSNSSGSEDGRGGECVLHLDSWWWY